MSGAAGRGHAIVIGAGFGGMAAALRLRAKGYAVTLLERGRQLGGRAQVLEREGFRHDAGPTVITAPFLLDELFALFGRRRSDHVALVPLAPWYRFHFPGGATFDYGGPIEETLAAIRAVEPADADGYLGLLEHSRRLYDKGFAELAGHPFHEAGTMARQVPALLRLRADRSVWQLVCRHLRHPRLREALSIQPLLVGGSPFDTTGIYGLIHYLERRWGVYYAVGGTGLLVAALGRLMEEQGIAIRLETTVSRVLLEGRRATGVELVTGERLSADVVVSNADPMYLYRAMLPERALGTVTRIKRRSRLSMGLFLLYFGTRRKYDHVARHTIWLGPRFRELLDDIFHRKVIGPDFSLYIHRPTATDPSFAPTGCDSFYALCPVPNLTAGIDWAQEGPQLRDRIVAALDRTLLPGLSAAITAELTMTPADFEARYLSFAGTGFSIAPYFAQSAWFRFHNKSESIDRLHLVGAGTHPGAGLPGVLSSAKVVEALVPPV
jgi:phytoene desaturase